MELRLEESNHVHVVGTVNNVNDYAEIKEFVDPLLEKKPEQLYFTFYDTETIPSSLIGYLLKIEKSVKIHLVITIYSPKLHELLDAIKLTSIFEIHSKF